MAAIKLRNPIQSHPHFHLAPQIQRANFLVSATNDEEAKAKVAAANADTGAPTIFDKIIAKEIPTAIVYEDEKVLAFRDINPQAPVHVLVIPKCRDGLTELGKAELRHREVLGHLLHAAKIVAEKEGIVDGFRVVINSGASACQSVYHLHLHVLGGRQMKWPPGNEAEGLRSLQTGIPLWRNSVPKISIHSDCQAVIEVAKNQSYNKKRYIRLRHVIVRDMIKNNVIPLDYLKSERNIANPLTKGLCRKMVLESAQGMSLLGSDL